MRILIPLLIVVACLVAVVLFARRVTPSAKDSPEVAEARGNLVGYARLQHERAESMARLLRDIRAQDDVLPILSASLRDRLNEELDR
ncbi:MAG TPA: hypothetical protein VGV93_07220 [Acidimicrobiales bacterium]|nr:hypothetical protein [Acidimicrobiales bacterium]